MTALEAVLGFAVVVLWLLMLRLHAELIVLRRDRDDALRQLRGLSAALKAKMGTRGKHE